MKRTATLLLSFLLVTIYGHAQHPLLKGTSAKHIIALNAFLQPQAALDNINARTTAGTTQQRVIAQTVHDSTGAINDSIVLSYPSYGGSIYDYNNMDYSYNYIYNTTPMFNFEGLFAKPQVIYDTLSHWYTDPFTLMYGPYEDIYAAYDVNHNLATYKDSYSDSVNNQNMSYDNTFNTVHNITKGLGFDLHSGIADSAFKQYFTYNTSNKLTEDSIYEYHSGAWRIVSKTYYTYTLTNLTQIDVYDNTTDTTLTLPLIEQLQYKNTYDASNRLNTVLINIYNGTTLSSYMKDTFAYSGTHTYHNSWKEYQYDAINGYWTPLYYMTKQINTAGLPDSVTIQSWDSLSNVWIPYSRDVIKYTSYNNPDTLCEYDYNFTNYPDTPSYTTVYYYGTYIDAVQDLATIHDDALVYPNPATNAITISDKNIAYTTPVVVTLINVSGQLISCNRLLWHGDLAISVADLLPGTYWLQMQYENGTSIHAQAIVKQ